MDTSIREIADGIFRVSTYVPQANLRFNQYLINADEPMIFHCGMRSLFAYVSAAVSQVLPLTRIRWICYGHLEADESGSMNEWLRAAPDAQVAVGRTACMLSAADLAVTPPQALDHGEVLDLGGKRIRYVATPHVPHGWDAGLLYEETTNTLLCGDLFTQVGDSAPTTSDDIVEPALEGERRYGATALTPSTAPTLRRLAELSPAVLGLMHGPAFVGDGASALMRLADGYAQLLCDALKPQEH